MNDFNDLERTAETWEAAFSFVVAIVIPALLILWGLTVGRIVERRHLRRLAARRLALAHVLVTDLKSFPGAGVDPKAPPQILIGEAVIAADYLKSFLAGLRKIIGGELRSYQNLMFRAREEALLRVIEQAHAQGYDAVCNMRLETADIAGSSGNAKNKATFCAVLASGTAYRRAPLAAVGTS